MHSYLIILVLSLTTIAIRFLPFIVFKKNIPSFIDYLGNVLPACAIAMLVVFCFRETDTSSIMPSLIASLLTITSYKLKHSTGLSIVIGTISYMFMIQKIF